MMKIIKPLIFTVCLVVVFAVGYTLGPGKGDAVDNTDELTRLQTELIQQSKSVEELQASLDASKSEQRVMKQSMAEAEAKQQARVTAAATNQDKYAANTDLGELNFYNDLPKQQVEPEPLQADPKKLAAVAAAASITAIALKQKRIDASVKPAAGTSNKPLTADQVLTPTDKKARKATAKRKPLPARYIPPGFERGKIPPPKTSKAATKTTKTSSKVSFMVQLGSFKSNEATSTLRKQLRKQGYTVHVKKAEVKGKPVFRVLIGPYHAGSKAKQAKKAVKKAMGISGLILKN